MKTRGNANNMKIRSLKLNAILNMFKQGCSILFPLITFPYVSRVLGNEGFGKYNFSFSIADYFIIFAALGISSYAIREGAKYREDRQITEQFCSEVFSINVFATIISAIVLCVLLASSQSLNQYSTLIIIITSQMIMATLGADWINSIFEDYLYITLRYIFIQVISLILIFVFVRSAGDVWKYAAITTFASAGGNIINIWYIRKYVKLRLVFNKDVLRHLKPILILFANTMAISIYVNADITMLKYYRSDAEVGIYSLSSRIYNILKRLISALILVTTARLSFYSKNNKDAYFDTAKNTFNALIVVLVPCMVGLIVMSRPVINLIGGQEYIDGWLPLCILSVAMIFALISAFYSNCILIVFSCDKALLTATVVSALINVLLNLFMLPLWGMIGASITTLIAEVVNLMIQYTYARRFLDQKVLNRSDLIKCIIASLLFAVVCVLIVHKFGDSYLSLVIGIPISCLIYFGSNLLMKNSSMISLIRFRRNR